MKHLIEQLFQQALARLQEEMPGLDNPPLIQLDRPKDKRHGDFACNIALVLAKQVQWPPRAVAEKIVKLIPASASIQKIEIAGPGFINVYLAEQALTAVVKTIFQQKEGFGLSQEGVGQKVMVEFVSANPTGPLHVGHGRGACYGAAVSDLLASQGFEVYREYYVNDAGRQMDILATSVWLRYLELSGKQFAFPSNGYKGEYIIDIAKKLQASVHSTLVKPISDVFAGVPPDLSEDGQGDKEAHIDALIANAKHLLGEAFDRVHHLALTDILDDIKEDLACSGVNMQSYFSEKTLVDSGELARQIESLKAKGLLYEKEGAWWFRSTESGDEKDRVVVRANGQHTYFATDIAYHIKKFERGFHKIIDIFGADHHGYIARIKASVAAAGYNRDDFHILLVQFATLYRGEERVQMSTRSGSFVTLRELRDEIGRDALRFFYVMRKCDQHMDFDLELAKSKSNDNPVYYIQYAYARVCSVFKQLDQKAWLFDQAEALAHLDRLTTEHEQAILSTLAQYPETLRHAALQFEPHLLANYLKSLAQDFHAYYNAHQILGDDEDLRQARLGLLLSVQQVIANGLRLLGVSTPEQM